MQNFNIKLFLSSKKEEKTFSSPLFIKVKICLSVWCKFRKKFYFFI